MERQLWILSRSSAISRSGRPRSSRPVSVRLLDRDEARQLAVRAQLLDATKPTDLVDLVDHLTLLQVDPTAAIAPNADLVAGWGRQPRCWSCFPREERLRSRDGNGFGISPSVSTQVS